MTQTWYIYDNCGDSSNCSQTVTVNCPTNCCTACTAPYAYSYSVTVYPGNNYLADNLCQGTNNTLNDVLSGVPDDTELFFWDQTLQDFDQPETYFAGIGWLDGSFNPSTATLTAGEGFLIYNPGPAFTLVVQGCLPDCPLPCGPDFGWTLVGGYTTGTSGWFDLFNCPPGCGTEFVTFDPISQSATTNTYINGVWLPSTPVLPVGQSGFVGVSANVGFVVSFPTNKTVLCNSIWTLILPPRQPPAARNIFFNQPGPSTNIMLTPVSTVTNGDCPQYITQTWLIADACGNSNICSQTVTVTGCCSNECCGPNAGAQSIQWLQLPSTGLVVANPLGTNPQGSWIVTNLGCYGNVLVTQTCRDRVVCDLNPNFVNVPNIYGQFDFTEGGYGPYAWVTTAGWLNLFATNDDNYTVTFYFLDGQPNPCSVVLGVVGLAENTTATVSQTVTFRQIATYELNDRARLGAYFAGWSIWGRGWCRASTEQ